MKKKKLKLDQLKVKSFVTELADKQIKKVFGGDLATIPLEECETGGTGTGGTPPSGYYSCEGSCPCGGTGDTCQKECYTVGCSIDEC